MESLLEETAADKAVESAMRLMENLEDGMVPERREPEEIAKAKHLFHSALTCYQQIGNSRKAAEQVFHLGYLARHVEHDIEEAKRLLSEAEERFDKIGDRRKRLATLLEWSEINPDLKLTEQAISKAIKQGLPEDLHYTEDPKRLAIAKRLAGDIDQALDLYDQFLEEALSQSHTKRAAMLLRETARIFEDDKKDRVTATEKLEQALTLAETAQDKEETAMVLLRLTDIYMERKKRDKAYEFFQRVERLKGLPAYQKRLIGPMRSYF